MTHKKGAYLGGVREIEDLRIRCRIDPDTGCWHWGLGFSDSRPRVRIKVGESEFSMNGRRAGLVLRDGANQPSGILAIPHPWCKASDCVNPAHSRWSSKADLGAQQRKRGTLVGIPSKMAANRRTAMARRVLTEEQVKMILNCNTPGTHLAREIGCSQQLISEVRRGNRYLTHMKRASVFTWRPGR